jgi:hypothetical protein
MVGNTRVFLIVRISPQAQRPIIDVATASEGTSKNMSLFIAWVKPVAVSAFLFHISHTIIYRVKGQRVTRKERRVCSLA